MQVFVVEFLTGGGLAGEALSSSLVAEGALMRDTLIGDLEDLPGVRIVTTHDSRLAPPPRGVSRAIGPADNALAIWAELAAEAHCSLPIAPETGGELERLVAGLRTRAHSIIAADADTLHICASKLATARCLAAAGLPVAPTWRLQDVPKHLTGPFVVKPDDGAGCLDVRLCENLSQVDAEGCVVQPFIEGAAESLTVLCQNGRAHVLTVNRQHVEQAGNGFTFHGVTVGARAADASHARLAQGILDALPGLRGLVGVDYVATARGPVIVEVNPRLTTSYAGLRRSLGINVLAFVADLIGDGQVPDVPYLPPSTPVEVLV